MFDRISLVKEKEKEKEQSNTAQNTQSSLFLPSVQGMVALERYRQAHLPMKYKLTFAAYSGSKHLEFLLHNNLPTLNPSWELDEVYTAGLMYPTRHISRAAPRPTKEQAEQVSSVVQQQTHNGAEDVMVLQRWNGKLIAEQFKLPDMEIEIERAVEQVERSIKAKDELVEEKLELEQATAEPGKTAKDSLPKEIFRPLEEKEKKIHRGAEDIGKQTAEK